MSKKVELKEDKPEVFACPHCGRMVVLRDRSVAHAQPPCAHFEAALERFDRGYAKAHGLKRQERRFVLVDAEGNEIKPAGKA